MCLLIFWNPLDLQGRKKHGRICILDSLTRAIGSLSIHTVYSQYSSIPVRRNEQIFPLCGTYLNIYFIGVALINEELQNIFVKHVKKKLNHVNCDAQLEHKKYNFILLSGCDRHHFRGLQKCKEVLSEVHHWTHKPWLCLTLNTQTLALPDIEHTNPGFAWHWSHKPWLCLTLNSQSLGLPVCRWFRFAQLAKGKKFRP
jgi:hypothetical protein